MTITIEDFLKRIEISQSELYLLPCYELVVYDNNTKIVYLPAATHNNTRLNPMADFRYHVGHMLLWSQHVELECTSDEMQRALLENGYEVTPYQEEKGYILYSLYKTPRAGAENIA
jgi:hypothetical protein